MRLIYALTTILVCGILGSAIAEGELTSGIELFHRLRRSVDTSESVDSEEVEDSVKIIREKCLKNGGPKAFDDVESSVEIAYGCIDSVLEMEEVKTDLTDAETEVNWNPFFKKYCPKVLGLLPCASNFTEPLRSCFEPKEQEFYDIFLNSTSLSLEFICRDEGSGIATFLSNGGPECFNSQKDDLRRCALDIFVDNVLGDTFENDSNDCAKLETLRNCTVTAFEKCDNPKLANFVDSLFQFLNETTTCEDISEESSEDDSKDAFKMVFEEKCLQNGGPTAYDTWKESVHLVGGALEHFVNGSQFRTEYVTAESNGNLEPVFKKYCRRSPIYKGIDEFITDSLKPCLEPEERISVDIIHNVSNTVLDFYCNNQADHLTKFIAGNGVECLFSKENAVKNCVNTIFTRTLSSVPFWQTHVTGLSIPFLGGSHFCTHVDNFQDCLVGVLNECPNKTASNILNSLIDAVKPDLPCGNLHVVPISTTTEIANTSGDSESNEFFEQGLQGVDDMDIITGLGDYKNLTVSNEIVENYLRSRCEKNGGPTAYEGAKAIRGYISENLGTVQDNLRHILGEMAEAAKVKSRSKLDVVLRNYCDKVPIVEEKIQYIVDSIKPCLHPLDQVDIDVIRNITTAFLEFLCHDGGDRVGSFVASGGGECWVAKQDAMELCFSQVGTALDAIKSTHGHTSPGECEAITNLKSCFVRVLNECENPTPGNMLESLMSHVIDASPCKDVHEE